MLGPAGESGDVGESHSRPTCSHRAPCTSAMIPPLFEKLLEEVGDNGRYQRLLYWLFVVPVNFMIPWVALVVIFMTSTPDHWCHVPGRPEDTPLEEWKVLSIPREEDGAYSSCSQYNVTASDLLPLLDHPPSPEQINATFGITECQHLWEYDHTFYDSTLTMQENWVCGRSSMAAKWQSVGVAGNVVGTLFFNSLSDQIGRRPVVAMTMAVYAVFGLVRLYVTSVIPLMITTFIASTSFPPMLELALILVLEQVSPGCRIRITSTSFVLWTLGMCFLPLIAWATRDWQLLGLVTTVPFFLIVIGCWFLPESPRWLLARGHLDQCSQTLELIAAKNGRKVPETMQETLQSLIATQELKSNYGALQLFTHRVVGFRTVLLTVCYSCYNLFYYGLAFNMSNLSGNEFWNFFLLGVVELPSNLLGWLSAQTVGRRWTAAGSSMLAALCAFATAFLQDENKWVSLMVLMLSKMFITSSFMVVYVQCAEVYPTTHRAAGTGLSSLVSSCFGITAPYIAYLAVYGEWAPYIILFVIALIGYLSASLLPETLDADLPQSLFDAKTFLTSEKYWSYKGRRFCTSKTPKHKSSAREGYDNVGNDPPTRDVKY